MKFIQLSIPVLFIIFGVLIELDYYEPSRRMGNISPWFYIILGTITLVVHLYLEFLPEKVKKIDEKYDLQSKIPSVLLIISIGIFFLFSFEDIFVNDAMNDIFRIVGLFGIIYFGANNYEKFKNKNYV